MSVHVIYYENRAKKMRPVLTAEEYRALRNSRKQRNQLAILRDGNSTPEQRKKAKMQLLQINYSCLPNADDTLKGATLLSNAVGMDVDLPEGNGNMPELEAHILQKKDELGLLMLERSATKGYHLVFLRHDDLSQEENLRWASDLLGVPFDDAAKDHTRVFFTTGTEDLLFLDERVFEIPIPASQPLPVSKQEKPLPASPQKKQSLPLRGGQEGFPTNYEGIPYAAIVEALAEQLGGVPVHGSRNNFIFSMACHLRYICDDNPDWIACILPTYGEDPQRVQKTIHSAISRAQSRNMPEILKRSIAVARSRNQLTNDKSNCFYFSPTPPPLPAKLPKLIELLTSKVPPMYKPAVAMAVFPPLGTHLHNVRARYIDNAEADLGGFMAVCLAKQSIGKGALNMPIDCIMADIREADVHNRELEANWKQQCKQSKANEKKPMRPTDICVQYLMSNMTNAALVQRLIDADRAGGRFLYARMDEIELLDQIRQSGGAKASEIIRLAFNQADYGAERIGQDSVSGTPPLRFNFNASSTVAAGQDYFKNGLMNGTLSRLTFSTIIKPDTQRGIPRFGNYDLDFMEQLRPFLLNLDSAAGLVECEAAERLAEQLAEENEELAAMSDDDVFATLSYRANKIAYDKAVLLYIAHGRKWDKNIAEFVRWSEQYDLWCKMFFFGQRMHELENQPRINHPGVRNMLSLLPERFSCDDLRSIRRAQGKSDDPAHCLAVWMNRGYITRDIATNEYVKTVEGRQRDGK